MTNDTVLWLWRRCCICWGTGRKDLAQTPQRYASMDCFPAFPLSSRHDAQPLTSTIKCSHDRKCFSSTRLRNCCNTCTTKSSRKYVLPMISGTPRCSQNHDGRCSTRSSLASPVALRTTIVCRLSESFNYGGTNTLTNCAATTLATSFACAYAHCYEVASHSGTPL